MTVLNPNRTRSLFGPLLLVGIGVVWLLANAGIIQPANLQVLFRFWPLIIIIIGIDLLIGRGNPRRSLIISVGGIDLLVVLMLVGPSLGLAQTVELKHGDYTWPVEGAASAQVNLDLAVAETSVRALNDSPNLIEASLTYRGDIDFSVTGEDAKVVTLKNTNTEQSFNFSDWGLFGGESKPVWLVMLNNTVPLDLNIKSGVSNSDVDLNGIQLTHLDISGGVGSLNLALPSADQPYDATLKTGTGSMDIRIAEGAAVNLDIQGGVGGVTIIVPEGSAVHVDAKTGLGSVDVPSGFEQVNGEKGVWQTEGFDSSTRPISIHFEGGVGGLTIQ